MTTIDSRNPRAATCEDWEEDQEEDTSLPETDCNTNANVARKRAQSRNSDTKTTLDRKSHDGSDSGYSSKAGTNDNILICRRKAADLRIDTEVVMERARQPYTQQPSRPSLSRTLSKKKDAPKEKVTKQQQHPVEERFRHPQGLCMTCDHYGFHIDPAPPAQVIIPPSPKASKTTKKVKDDSPAQARPRRTSSKREGRPVSLYVGAPTQQPVYTPQYAHPVVHPQPYQYQPPSPVTPSTNIVPYQHYPQQSYIPDTPISTSYSATPGGYLDAYMASHDPYHQHAPSPGYYATAEPVQPYYNPYPVQEPVQHRPSHGSGTGPVIKSNRTIEEDRRAMPPPARPGLKKSTTEKASKRQSVHCEADERPDVTAKPLSREYCHPPTAYRAPSSETSTRPRPSKSYSTGSEPIIVTSSSSRPRHNTDPPRIEDFIEQRTVDAEAYIARTSRTPIHELTAETLKKISSRPLASDAGTHKSKESSRSRMSTSGKTTILMNNGVSVSLPQDISEDICLQLGNVTLSVTNQDQSKGANRQIEPRSQSRRSTTSGSTDGQSLRRESTRKSEQTEPTTHSANTGRKSSQSPSSTVANLDDRKRVPLDVKDNPEAFYGA